MTETSRLGTKPALGIKAPVVAATTANITLSGEQTIDGVSVVAGNRVLVKDQTTTTENGIYVCAAGAWSRATDYNDSGDVVSGTMVLDVNQDTVYQGTFTGTFTAGTTVVTFAATGDAFTAAAAASATAAAASATAAEAARDDLTGDIVGGDAGKPMGVNPGEDGFVVLDALPADFVVTASIADGNVTTAKIADANVTTAKIADSNVTTAKIADDNVTTAKIADSNVTTAKIASGAVDETKVSGGVATFYEGSNPDLTDYPVGTILLAIDSTGVVRNAAADVYYVTATTGKQFQIGSGTAQLSGTWRARGWLNNGGGGSDPIQMVQRVS